MKISGIVLVAGWSVGNCLLRVQEQFAVKKKVDKHQKISSTKINDKAGMPEAVS